MHITSHDLKLKPYVAQTWRVVVPEGTSAEDVLNKETYEHIASNLTIGDTIEIVTIDYSDYFEVIVVTLPPKGKGCTWAIVKLLNHAVLQKKEGEFIHEDVSVEFNASNKKHRVLKNKKTVLVDEFDTREEADIFAKDFVK
jgi:hypothetical protein